MSRCKPAEIVIVVCLAIVSIVAVEAGAADRIHCVTYISHDFSFYFDGRFGANYVAPDGIDVRNWGTLHKYDLTDANLLILQSSASPCRYLPEDVEAVRGFLGRGGGVVVLGDYALFREEKEYHPNALLKPFGARFADTAAQKPLDGDGVLEHEEIACYSPKSIVLEDPADWQILVNDAQDRVIMAKRPWGKGQLLVGSRSLCGRNPNASDPINDHMFPLTHVTLNDHQRQRINDTLLNHPLERACPEGGFVPLFEQQISCRFRQGNADLPLAQQTAHVIELNIRNLAQMFPLQAVENDRFIHPVQKFRSEMASQGGQYPILHLGSILHVNDVLTANIAGHNNDRVAEINRAPLPVR